MSRKKIPKKVKEKIKASEEEGKEGHARAMQKEFIRLKNDYITNLINARYFLARMNMIGEQINAEKILENIDGAPKTEDFMRAEYALFRLRAMNSLMYSNSAKDDLITIYKLGDKELFDIEKDYYEGKIIRESYEPVDDNGAKFVNPSEDS